MALIGFWFFAAGFSTVAAIYTGDARACLIAIVSFAGLVWAARRGR